MPFQNLQELAAASNRVSSLIDDFRSKRLGLQISLTDWSVITVFATSPVPTLQRSVAMVASTGYYESHTLITRLLTGRIYRQAAPAEQARISAILAQPNGLVAIGQAYDDATDSAKTSKLGDGTLLKLLLDNLPAIIAAIEEILKLFPKTTASNGPGNISVASAHDQCSSASHADTAFAVPPGLILALEQAVSLLWPLIEKKIDDYIKSIGA